ncbi:hypothetical protein DVF44_23125 [Salmonella enterica subsp. enterica serovar Schwarzengrund]|nr:hypothetical protein [Salmonella enterica subsp. enterica serovar Schwarzengrund]
MHKIIKLFLFFITLSTSQSYAVDNKYISANNSKAFSFFLPTGMAMADQYIHGIKRYSVNEIINDFDDNEMRAKKKYKGTFILNSTVKAIKQSILNDRPYVILEDGDGLFNSFFAYYDKDSADELELIDKGDNVDFLCFKAKKTVSPSAECYSYALNAEVKNISERYQTIYDNVYKKQNKYKTLKISFIIYSLLENEIEKNCEESIEACNIAARKFTENGALLGTMLEPYADMLSKIRKIRFLSLKTLPRWIFL